jgi:hypothetical protein
MQEERLTRLSRVKITVTHLERLIQNITMEGSVHDAYSWLKIKFKIWTVLKL